MFNSFLIPMIASSDRLAPRFFDNHAKVNAAIEASSRDMSLVFYLMIIAIVVVGVIVSINRTQNSRKDEQIAIKELALTERTARAEERAAKQTEELANARHMIAILRAGSYVPQDDVPEETPSPDSVFGAKPVTPADAQAAEEEAESTEDEGEQGSDTSHVVPDARHPEAKTPDVTDDDIEWIMAQEDDMQHKK